MAHVWRLCIYHVIRLQVRLRGNQRYTVGITVANNELNNNWLYVCMPHIDSELIEPRPHESMCYENSFIFDGVENDDKVSCFHLHISISCFTRGLPLSLGNDTRTEMGKQKANIRSTSWFNIAIQTSNIICHMDVFLFYFSMNYLLCRSLPMGIWKFERISSLYGQYGVLFCLFWTGFTECDQFV